ncbi:MAG TPA: SAM-dependent methyltransferase [Ramlibacter sp.]
MSDARGTLYLVPTPLDFGCAVQAPVADVLPAATIARAASIRHWICENAKSARAFLKRIDAIQPLAAPLQQLQIDELPRAVHKKGDHDGTFDAAPLLAPALGGDDIGLLSEAGMPAVADPGSSVVRAAHDLGIGVVPLVGPGALLMALAASGLNGQNFAFVGYLPQDAAARAQRLRELESMVAKTGQTQLFIETPYRNAALWKTMCETLQPKTRAAVASGLTLPDARIACASIAQWRQREAPVSNDVPAVFAIGR